MNLFVFGLGYSALHWVRTHRSLFGRVGGTVRSPEAAEALGVEGIEARGFALPDTRDIRIENDLDAADALLVSVPPGGDSTLDEADPVLRTFGDAIVAAPRLAWIGYLSTIGVYGDRDGAWVDETTLATPTSPRSEARLRAEEGWLGLGRRSGKPVQVFRLAGIYGPGRNPLRNLRDGTARRIVKPGQMFNRVHVDDIAAVLAGSLARPRSGGVYNVADDEPAPPQDVVAYAAALLGAPPPPEERLETAALSPMAKSFYAENKRASNRLIREELGVALRHPTYREGLRALLEAGEGRSL